MTAKRWSWPSTSKQSRGYGADWERKRKRILERDYGLCQCEHCKADGLVTRATEVDHKVSKAKAKTLGWSDEQIEDETNLQAINKRCHERKTIEEQGKKIKPVIGLDGFPIRRGGVG